jgi:O-antigen ligase
MRVFQTPRHHWVDSFRDWWKVSKASLVLPAAVLIAWFAGRALVAGGSRQGLILGVAGVALVAPFAHAYVVRRLGHGFLAVEAPLLFLLLSTLVLRSRTTDQLAYNPLDPAAQFRVACVVVALILGGLALTSSPFSVRDMQSRLTTLPVRLYLAYIVVVFAGASLSVSAGLTAYRGVELVAAVVVLLGAVKALGNRAIPRLEAVLYWFAVALVASVWLGVILNPGEAVHAFANRQVPIQFQIIGVNPIISSNSVGALGVFLVIWSLARAHWPEPARRLRRSIAYTVAAVGFATLLAAQYRTGYVSFVVTLMVLFLIRRKWHIALLLLLGAIGFLVWSPSIVTEAQPYVLRGQSVEEARGLSQRVDWWGDAIDVWRTSPVVGRGLRTASRFEVLAPQGRAATSTIHGTWIEALLGTGLVGVALLVLSYLITVRRALDLALRGGRPLPLLLLTPMTVRSLTGTSVESFGFDALVFLLLALYLTDGGEEDVATGALRGTR